LKTEDFRPSKTRASLFYERKKMPETKAVQDVKQLEEKLAAARESARAAFIQIINENLAQLKAIGFSYELAENGAAPNRRLGRPRKEKADGVVQ
jgi:hypothetical protein